MIIVAIVQKMDSLQHFKQNLTDPCKRELPMLTFYSMEHAVLERCLIANIDL